MINRHARRSAAAQTRKLAMKRPQNLTPVPAERWPPMRLKLVGVAMLAVWESKDYLVQTYTSPTLQIGGERFEVFRITVHRVTLDKTGRFDADISWEELQAIKAAVGLGDAYALEIYPCEIDLVNVANMRHLWVLDRPLPLGWFAGAGLE